MGLKDYLSTICETSERHHIAELRTRYYRNDSRKTHEAILTTLNRLHWPVLSDNKEYNEIIVESNRFQVMISIFRTTPFETAVDVKVVVKTFIGMNQPRNIAILFYNELKKDLNLKGTGLGG